MPVNYYRPAVGASQPSAIRPTQQPQQQPYQQQQNSQNFVPNHDSPDNVGFETEDQKKLRESQNQVTSPSVPMVQQQTPAQPAAPMGGAPRMSAAPTQQRAASPTTSTPMISPDGSIPPGIPYSPTPPLASKPAGTTPPPVDPSNGTGWMSGQNPGVVGDWGAGGGLAPDISNPGGGIMLGNGNSPGQYAQNGGGYQPPPWAGGPPPTGPWGGLPMQPGGPQPPGNNGLPYSPNNPPPPVVQPPPPPGNNGLPYSPNNPQQPPPSQGLPYFPSNPHNPNPTDPSGGTGWTSGQNPQPPPVDYMPGPIVNDTPGGGFGYAGGSANFNEATGTYYPGTGPGAAGPSFGGGNAALPPGIGGPSGGDGLQLPLNLYANSAVPTKQYNMTGAAAPPGYAYKGEGAGTGSGTTEASPVTHVPDPSGVTDMGNTQVDGTPPPTKGPAPQAGQWAPTNRGFFDWAVKTFGFDPKRPGFVDANANGGLQAILKRYVAETGNKADFKGGPSGDQVDFGAGIQDALTSQGQLWYNNGSGGAGTSSGPIRSNIPVQTGVDPIGSHGSMPDPSPSQQSNITPPTYTPYNFTQFNQNDPGLQSLLNLISGTHAQTYNPATFDQFQGLDQSGENGDVLNWLHSMMGTQQQGTPGIDALQNSNLTDILSNPTYSDDYKNKLNEQQKELITQRGKANQESISADAARRGVTDSGYTDAARRRASTTEGQDLLKSQRDVDIQTTGANRQSMLDALTASQGIKSSNANINSQGFSNAATAQGILTGQNNNNINNYNTHLGGQQAQASENLTGIQSIMAAMQANNASASNYSNIRNNNYMTGLAGQNAQAGQNQAAFTNAMAAANFGLQQNQFNQQTKQFDRTFIEQIRQFDKQLAQQMEQFNLSNQQGYDLANLGSQNNLINQLLNGGG